MKNRKRDNLSLSTQALQAAYDSQARPSSAEWAFLGAAVNQHTTSTNAFVRNLDDLLSSGRRAPN